MSKLAIVIPTRNNSPYLSNIVTNLHTFLFDLDYQIVISNNSDKEIHLTNLEVNVVIINTPRFFPTAEEHLFWASQQVTSEYVWFLGDDDIPQEEGVFELINILKRSNQDLIMFNGLRQKLKKGPIKLMVNSNKKFVGLLSEFYEKNGMLNGPASISLYVVNREYFSKFNVKEISNLKAPIYSHLFFLMNSLKGSKILFCPMVLIKHNVSDPEQNSEFSLNWVNYAALSSRYYFYPWTLGFLKQMDYLIQNKIVDPGFLGRIVEFAPDGKRYSLIRQIEEYIRQSLIIEFENLRNIENQEIKELRGYVNSIEGFSDDIKDILNAKNPSFKALSMYPHATRRLIRGKNLYLKTKYRIRIVFVRAPVDYFWIILTKLWNIIPKWLRRVLKKFIFRMWDSK
jgi:hypothetical protein